MAAELAVRHADDVIGLARVVKDEDRVDLDLAASPLQSDHGRVADALVADEDLLDVAGVHLRAVRHDQHVLLAALEGQEALRVHDSVVTGAIPAVLSTASVASGRSQ